MRDLNPELHGGTHHSACDDRSWQNPLFAKAPEPRRQYGAHCVPQLVPRIREDADASTHDRCRMTLE
ncbi:MAG: hypothetical protein K5882_05630 [Bacteroidales bacterium]|nr:hypothetical protein [Bacteroidales bacterium]